MSFKYYDLLTHYTLSFGISPYMQYMNIGDKHGDIGLFPGNNMNCVIK